MRINPQVRDSVIYLLAGLGVVCLGAYLGLHPPKHGIDPKWIVFGLMTAVIFGLLVQGYWRYGRSPKLWLNLFILLLVHISVFRLLLPYYSGHWPLFAIVVLFTGEGMFLAVVMYWILGVIPHYRSPKDGINDKGKL